MIYHYSHRLTYFSVLIPETSHSRWQLTYRLWTDQCKKGKETTECLALSTTYIWHPSHQGSGSSTGENVGKP